MKEINISHRESTVVEESQKLFSSKSHSSIWLKKYFVSHEKGTHHLQERNFNWVVERSDNCCRSIRESVTCGGLASPVSRVLESLSEVTDIVSSKVFEEINGNLELSCCLNVALWATLLDTLYEKFKDLLVIERFDYFAANFPIHKIPLWVLEGIVESCLRTLSH